MKSIAVLKFDLDNETDAERFRCAQKGFEMSGMIDSFLDYLSLVACADLEKLTANELYETIYSMYRSKIVQSDLKSMCREDVQYLFGDFEEE